MAETNTSKITNASSKKRKLTSTKSAEDKKRRRIEKGTDSASSAKKAHETIPPPIPRPAESASTSDEKEENPEALSIKPTEMPEASVQNSKERFIVFIGNLPYTATTAKLKAHFASIRPTSIRHLTQKGSDKSKGYAFLEFDAYDRMKTCLKLYHHSNFEDDKGRVRRINVELTAGGGGKGKGRREKLKAKNTKLGEERKRRAVEEAKKEKRQKKKKAETLVNGNGSAAAKADDFAASEAAAAEELGVHPSRRAQVPTR